MQKCVDIASLSCKMCSYASVCIMLKSVDLASFGHKKRCIYCIIWLKKNKSVDIAISYLKTVILHNAVQVEQNYKY